MRLPTRSQFVAFWGFLLLTSSCAPQGQWNRRLHPLHTEGSRPASAAANNMLQPGLPSFCRELRFGTRACLECRVDVWQIQRCLPAQHPVPPKLICRSTPDAVKCLSQEGAKALSLPLRRPGEQVLADHFALWEETVRTIWIDRKSDADRRHLETLLGFLESLTARLSEGHPEDWDRGHLLDLLGRGDALASEEEAQLEVSWRRLLERKWDGSLDLTAVLEESRQLLAQLGVEAQRLTYLQALSVEGLRDDTP